MIAPSTPIQAAFHVPILSSLASRADEAVRPTQSREIFPTAILIGKPVAKLGNCLGIIGHAAFLAWKTTRVNWIALFLYFLGVKVN